MRSFLLLSGRGRQEMLDLPQEAVNSPGDV
jgi:hypothetical protein